MKHHGPLAMEDVEGVIDCVGCGLIHKHPLPTEKEYREKVRSFYSGGSIWQEPPPEDREWMKLEFEAFRKTLERVEYRVEYLGTLLDIGAGKELFVDHMRAHGHYAVSLDPATSGGIEGFIEDEQPTMGFDAVSMISLLEHVLDPKLVLQKAREWLKPGGALLVKVPNDFSFLQKAALREGLVDRAWWVHEDHNYYFDFPGLKLLLESQGFEVMERTTSYPMEWAIVYGSDYVTYPDVGGFAHMSRRGFDKRLGSHRDEFYRRLARSGIGRHVIYLARKA